MNFAYLLLGSNLDNRSALLERAKEAISSRIGNVTRESSVYESEPWGFQSEHRFLNQVIRIETKYRPIQVLEEILRIEKKLGRHRADDQGYTSRSIDIDILFYNDEIISEDKLTIPHPKIPERMFTLLPLSEIDRSMIHPGSRKSISDLMRECPDTLNVYPYRPKL
ncbi:MAG: 2-amino-4-hydroxy-6-hydroxymethyldihydropteridine diphosphokinase [Bacteroidales bacterium]|nr:2-amino-4-hydroxy-6-hydroxymethyldihydropteridine diphosphokinase [Bacteroidales bacterium]